MHAQVFDELARAIRTLDLPVAEHVARRDDLFPQELHALHRVVRGPVVAVGEVERIDVPLALGIVLLDDLDALAIRRRDHRAARLLRLEEGVAVDLTRARVVDDVAALDALVLAA